MAAGEAPAPPPGPAPDGKLPGRRLKLSQLCIAQCDAELSRVRRQLEALSARNAENARRREELAAAERRREEAQKAGRAQRERAAILLQAAVRGRRARRDILQACLLRDPERLSQSREVLAEAMADLHRCVHGAREAATAIQAWWRGLLARRVCAVLRLHGRLLAVHRRMQSAAVVVQARYRGVYARIFCRRASERRRQQRARQELEAVERSTRAARRIQAAARAALTRRALERKAALHAAAAAAVASQALCGAAASAAGPADAAPAAAAQAPESPRRRARRTASVSPRVARSGGHSLARHRGQGGRATAAGQGAAGQQGPPRRGGAGTGQAGRRRAQTLPEAEQAPRRGGGERSALRAAERRLASEGAAGRAPPRGEAVGPEGTAAQEQSAAAADR